MNIEIVQNCDIGSWLELAKEVEPLFGPMVVDSGFHEALKTAISEKRAYCIRNDSGKLCGVVAISLENNEIEWFAVRAKDRRKGYGKALLSYALTKLNPTRPMTVQTFDKTILDGLGARNLYIKLGFEEIKQAGLNPAGLPTVILRMFDVQENEKMQKYPL